METLNKDVQPSWFLFLLKFMSCEPFFYGNGPPWNRLVCWISCLGISWWWDGGENPILFLCKISLCNWLIRLFWLCFSLLKGWLCWYRVTEFWWWESKERFGRWFCPGYADGSWSFEYCPSTKTGLGWKKLFQDFCLMAFPAIELVLDFSW